MYLIHTIWEGKWNQQIPKCNGLLINLPLRHFLFTAKLLDTKSLNLHCIHRFLDGKNSGVTKGFPC